MGFRSLVNVAVLLAVASISVTAAFQFQAQHDATRSCYNTNRGTRTAMPIDGSSQRGGGGGSSSHSSCVTRTSFKISTPSTALRMSPTLYPVSGVDSLPILQQQLTVAGAFLGLGIGTTGLVKGLDGVDNSGVLPDGWFANWKATLPLLGVVYVLAGLAHFGVQDAFVSIFPPQGTWGFWYLPGSPEFHVAWTGIAEFLGGLGLLLGGFGTSFLSKSDGDGTIDNNGDNVWATLTKVSAGSLALLTLAVSPANIYMYTHGAIMVGAGPDAPLELQFHGIRFVAQIVLLSLFLVMTATTTASTSNSSSPASQDE